MQQNKFKINIEESVEISNSTKSFVFEAHSSSPKLISSISGIKNYYSDISTLGKHFTVVSYGGEGTIAQQVRGRTLRRHFTIANCMRGKFYNELIRILKAENQSFAMEHSNVTFDISLLNSELFHCLILKNPTK